MEQKLRGEYSTGSKWIGPGKFSHKNYMHQCICCQPRKAREKFPSSRALCFDSDTLLPVIEIFVGVVNILAGFVE